MAHPLGPTAIRFGELRKLKFMLPMDDLRLGWPDAFPGKYATKMRHGSNEVRRWEVLSGLLLDVVFSPG